MKDKTANTVSKVLDRFFRTNRPQKIEADLGTEFWNKKTLAIVKKYKIQIFTVHSDFKGAIIERFNRTQKNKLFRLFTSSGSHVWINDIDVITRTYNKTYHRSIGTSPSMVTKDTEKTVRKKLYPEIQNIRKIAKYKIGDTVRLLRKDGVFARGFKPNYTDEIFYINKIQKTEPITYSIKDYKNEGLKGSFYGRELVKVNKREGVYPVEKIVKKRRTSNGIQLLIKWRGYPEEANSWIPETDLYPLKNAPN